MNRKPAIISIKGYNLTKKEKKLIKQEKPWGIILFKRNIKNFDQVKNLTTEIRKCLKDQYYPILIDEEGGIVSRFSNLINSSEFSQKFFGKIFEMNNLKGKMIYEYYLNSVCSVLKNTGINVNTIPVMDLLNKSSHKIIKNRCYSNKTKVIKSLGRICIDNLKNNKIGSVAKHIPGHGKGNADSHKKMPIVNDSPKNLYLNDFSTFKDIKSHFVMTAHILYKKIDPKFVATQSKIIIEKIIRKKLGFKGLIISDDISMKALKFGIKNNTTRAFKAGCDIVLHCNANLKEMMIVAKNSPIVSKLIVKKTSQLINIIR